MQGEEYNCIPGQSNQQKCIKVSNNISIISPKY